MGLDHHAPQPQQTGPVVHARIDTLREPREDGLDQRGAELGHRVLQEGLLHECGDELGHPFAGLQRHIAHEAVGHHHIDIGMKNAVALDVADVVDRHGLQ